MKDILNRLNGELLEQPFAPHDGQLRTDDLTPYRDLARHYACIEGAVAVLSDLRANTSLVCYGACARMLGLKGTREGTDGELLDSIWEREILDRIHPDDLHEKYLLELCFFHFIRSRPRRLRGEYYFANRLWMKDRTGRYVPVLHRLFYVAPSSENVVRLALCLYTPALSDFPGRGVAVHTATGEVQELGERRDVRILSKREQQVIELMARGMMSKHIAQALSISIHTVSRHRQDILRKLRVGNSVEACRVARELGIL